MRNVINLSGVAAMAMLVMMGAASAQSVIQPQYQAGAGSGQSFLFQPGPSAEANAGNRSSAMSSTGSQGPVTNYGAGGLVHEPGTVVNPPYFRGTGMARGR